MNIQNETHTQTVLANLADLSASVTDINLVEQVNLDNGSFTDFKDCLRDSFKTMINKPSYQLQGFDSKKDAFCNKVMQTITRHNQVVLWNVARALFETETETVQFLGKIGKDKNGFIFKVSADNKVIRSKFTQYGYAKYSYIAIGFKTVKQDKKAVDVNIELSLIDKIVEQLTDCKTEYYSWLDELSKEDHTPEKNENPSVETVDTINPDTLPLTDTANLKTDLADTKTELSIKAKDLDKSLSEIEALKAYILTLEDEKALLIDNLSSRVAKQLGYTKSARKVG